MSPIPSDIIVITDTAANMLKDIVKLPVMSKKKPVKMIENITFTFSNVGKYLSTWVL